MKVKELIKLLENKQQNIDVYVNGKPIIHLVQDENIQHPLEGSVDLLSK